MGSRYNPSDSSSDASSSREDEAFVTPESTPVHSVPGPSNVMDDDESPLIKSCDETIRAIKESLTIMDQLELAERHKRFKSSHMYDDVPTPFDADEAVATVSFKELFKGESLEDMIKKGEVLRKLEVPSPNYNFCERLAQQSSGFVMPNVMEEVKKSIKEETAEINRILSPPPKEEERKDEPKPVSKCDDNRDVDSFHIAYNNFTQTRNEDDLLTVRDLALASASSSSDIDFIDGDYFVEANATKTEELSSTLFDGEIQELQQLLNSLAESSPSHRSDVVGERKSNLKRKLLRSPKLKASNKVKKIKFTNVTIFYFQRSQGFVAIPTKGGSTLGMSGRHFYITTLPIDDYEHRKIQRVLPTPRSNNAITGRIEKPKNIEALSDAQRMQLLASCNIKIQEEEEKDCAMIRLSRATSGCDCKEYCDPDVCSCNLFGVECQVDRPNYPCSCTRDQCHNKMGRNEYNHNKVKIHFIKTMRKVSAECKRVSKRKSSSSARARIHEPAIESNAPFAFKA